MRLSLIFGICATFLFTLHTGISLAQTGFTGYKNPKSADALVMLNRTAAH